MSWCSCCRRPLRILNSGRARTPRYSAIMALLTYSLAGLVIASTSTVRWSPSGFRAAETRIFVSMTRRGGIISCSPTPRFSRPSVLESDLNDPINLRRAEGVRALAPRLVSDQLEHFWFGRGEPHVVPDAQQHRLRGATLFNDERPAFVRHPAQQLAKIGAGVQGGDHDTVILVGSQHCELSSSIIRTVHFNCQ